MFNHVTLGSNDIARSKAFYDATLAALGVPAAIQDAKGRLFYLHDGGMLMITTPLNGQPATPSNGFTLGFKAATPEQAAAWHKAGVENGGTAIENPPGVRPLPTGDLYLAYLKDPDGNKLCAVHKMPAA
ncbi:VOC family protein [Acetobacter cibinongensis]|uniref:Glyoxalase n=1 Tax=Acetobacter cibinongensis TaxID=146475 RepID=A0A1Z5YXD3_9PROT|nr:VOC family protein [Acetobacter cibinongensis]OUJ03992.1 glyoxalase [Acetobacter cibinongensis]